jgi:hypothetical protein
VRDEDFFTPDELSHLLPQGRPVDSPADTPDDLPIPLDRWKNRRAMAWISLLAALAFPVLLLLTKSDQLGAVAGTFYLFVSAVVGAYIGFATVDDHLQKDRPPRRAPHRSGKWTF